MLSTGPAEILSGVPRYVMWSLIASGALLAALVLLYLSRLSAQPALRQPPGSRVALAIGENFSPSDRFTGFVDENSGASVVVVELPGAAYEQLKRLGDTAQAFEAQGLLNVERVTLRGRQGDYVYLRGQQKTALVDYAKYVLIFPEQGLTVMITANIPEAALTSGAVTGAAIETIFASATVKPEAMQADSLFTLGYLGPFEEDLSLLGTTKGYRLRGEGPARPDDPGLRPLFLVAPSLTQAPIPNLSLFAERSFQTIEQVRDKSIEARNALTVAGLDAFEVLGAGTDARSGEPCLVYQVVIEAAHGGYFRLVGLAPASEREKYLAEFRRISESFAPKPKP